MKILVVGASGQLGMAAVRRMLARGGEVRTLVRSDANAGRLRSLGADAVLGDLTDRDSLDRACTGIDVVVTTANAAMPSRRSDTFEAVELHGNRNLIEAARTARVQRFVFTSVPQPRRDAGSRFLRFKLATERTLEASGLEYVILRADIFMDVTFAMMGSSLPLRGAESATVLRPFGFANRHFARIQDSIERRRVAMIPGDGTKRHTFICVEDVAAFLDLAAHGGPSGTFAIGGPEALTFRDVVRIYERIEGASLRVQSTPAIVFRVAAALLKPFSPAGANLMMLNYLAATEETLADASAASAFGVRLTSAEEFLRGKAATAAAG